MRPSSGRRPRPRWPAPVRRRPRLRRQHCGLACSRWRARRVVRLALCVSRTLPSTACVERCAVSSMGRTPGALSAGRVLSRFAHQTLEQAVQPRLACAAQALLGGLGTVGPMPRVGERERDEHKRTGSGPKWSQSHERSPRSFDAQVSLASTFERPSRRARTAPGGACTVRGFSLRIRGGCANRVVEPAEDRGYRSYRPIIKD